MGVMLLRYLLKASNPERGRLSSRALGWTDVMADLKVVRVKWSLGTTFRLSRRIIPIRPVMQQVEFTSRAHGQGMLFDFADAGDTVCPPFVFTSMGWLFFCNEGQDVRTMVHVGPTKGVRSIGSGEC